MSKNNSADIVCLGVLIMDMFPDDLGCSLIEVSAFRPVPGGAPAAEGVETKGIRFDKRARTTMNFHAKPDEKTIEYLFYRNPGADTQLKVDELDQELLEKAKVLHFDSLCLTNDPCRTATIEAIKIAKKNGAIISFDVNYRPPVWKTPEKAKKEIEKIKPFADLIKVNEDEMLLLAGTDYFDIACEIILEQGPDLCVATLGRKGSCFGTKNAAGFVPAFEVDAVDPIGCGDAFSAGLLTKLIPHAGKLGKITTDQFNKYLTYANAVCALTATKQGVIPALPKASAVKKFLDKMEG